MKSIMEHSLLEALGRMEIIDAHEHLPPEQTRLEQEVDVFTLLGKGFSKVWLNLCWLHIISERCAALALDEAIDLLPANKLIAFGGDYRTPVEKVYGHLVMSRGNIARVLARRVDEGRMSQDEALGLARRWLWDNPRELYRLQG